jgi:excisionase family DNA binding protein
MVERLPPLNLTTMSERRPYTTKTAAEYLGASPAHVRNLCARGKLRHFRLGGDANGPIRIPADALEEFERCASSCSVANGMHTNASMANRNERAWGQRIVRLQPAG